MAHTKLLPEKLNWSLLYTFLVIAEEKSISLAAVRLNLTQSAVSHSLKRLETQVGVRLIERSHRRFSLTEQGLILHETASSIYSKITQLDSQLNRGGESISDTLTLWVLSRIVSDTFDEFLIRFRQHYPQIKINMEMLTSAEILQKIGKNASGIGLSLCRQEVKNINRIFLIPQRYGLYCGKYHPLFAKEHIRKSDLVSQNFVSFFSEQLGDALSPLAVFRDKQQFTGEVVASTNNLDEVKRLLYVGYGIGCLPDNAAKKDVLEGNLRRLPPEKGIVDVPIYIVWNQQRKLKPAEVAFIDSLQAAFNLNRGVPVLEQSVPSPDEGGNDDENAEE